MLARASSDAGTRLRRSKSNTIVHRSGPPVIEPLNPNVAQQHAIAAATAAFARPQSQRSTERKGGHSFELRRARSTTSRKSLNSQGSHFPPRELSVRSVPPQNSTQVSSINRCPVASASRKDRLHSFEPPPMIDRPLPTSQPALVQPAIALSEHPRPMSQPKPHRQSAASSATSQQIRKARSMYYASSVQTGSPIARLPAKYLTTPPVTDTSPAEVPVPKAYIPTRGIGPSPLAVPQVPATIGPDETVESARDRYLQNFQQHTVKNKPSIFLAPFRKRQDRSKEDNKRLSSVYTPTTTTDCQFTEDASAEITVNNFLPQSNAKDRRSFSGSLKRRIRKVFRRTSGKSLNLPVQQIEASRDYFTEARTLTTSNHIDIPSPDEGLLRRVRSRPSSSDGSCPQPVRSASRSSSKESTHSNRSLHSEVSTTHTSASRVTSWDALTSGDALTQRAIKRLTVIHEAKDSVGSLSERPASIKTKRKSLPVPAFSAFKDPMHMESLTEETSTPPVDPKRVFSALMREIDASNSNVASVNRLDVTPDAESGIWESTDTTTLHLTGRKLHTSTSRESGMHSFQDQQPSAHCPRSVATRSVQSKKDPIKSFGQVIRSTICTVTPGGYASSPWLAKPVDTQPDTRTPSTDASSRSHSGSESRATMFKNFRVPRKRSAFNQRDTAKETSTPTAEQIEIRIAKAKARWQTPLDESTTPQFPRETDRFHTLIDLVSQQCSDQGATLEAPASPSIQKLQPSKTLHMPMSPSVYSRDTDGFSILPNDSVMSLASPREHEPTNQSGSAVILNSRSVRSYVIGTPSPDRPSSTRSSRDWRDWLSHEISGIEATNQEDVHIYEQYTTPLREVDNDLTRNIRTSQTGSEDTTVIERGSYDKLTPRAQPRYLSIPAQGQQVNLFYGVEDHLTRIMSTPEDTQGITTTRKSLSLQGSNQTAPEQQFLVATPPDTCAREGRSKSTPSSTTSSPQPRIGTPGSARMNDRFPFIDTGRRPSSRNSSQSRQSKSPTESPTLGVNSPKAIPELEGIYCTDSSPSTSTAAANTTLQPSQVLHKGKENVTPPSTLCHKRQNITPLGLVSRPKSSQPRLSTVAGRSAINTADQTSRLEDISRSKRASCPVGTVIARPNLRVTIRPLSPQKFSRRPRSAFDLRNTPPPRPASELRRPTVQTMSSSRSSAQGNVSVPDIEESSDTAYDSEQRSGSITPGQRMADRFLRERKSTTVLERGVRKSTGKIIREDTPAFL